MRIVFVYCLLFVTTKVSVSQDIFDYNVVVKIDQVESDMSRFKGKPMLMELFGEYCIVCFKKMPLMNELQNLIGDKMSIVLLGNDRKRLPRVFDMFKKKYNLDLVAAFDSSVFSLINPPFVPYFIWVDKTGRIVAKTDGEVVTKDNLESFCLGDSSFFSKRKSRVRIDARSLILPEKSRVIEGSYFLKYNDSLKSTVPDQLRITEQESNLQFVNVRVKELYRLAGIGKLYWNRFDQEYEDVWPYIELDNDSELKDLLEQKVCYSMINGGFRPTEYLQKRLQRDLEFTFGYRAEVIFERKPVWVVRFIKDAKVISNNLEMSQPEIQDSYVGVKVKGGSIDQVLQIVEYQSQIGIPLINETGISGAIDLKLDVVMTEWDDVKKAMEDKGFSFEKSSRIMKVLKLVKVK